MRRVLLRGVNKLEPYVISRTYSYVNRMGEMNKTLVHRPACMYQRVKVGERRRKCSYNLQERRERKSKLPEAFGSGRRPRGAINR